MLKMTPGSDVEVYILNITVGVKIYNYLYKEFNICYFVEVNANKKDYKLKRVISFLVKKENFNGEEPQYEINLPALLISFLKSFLFYLQIIFIYVSLFTSLLNPLLISVNNNSGKQWFLEQESIRA